MNEYTRHLVEQLQEKYANAIPIFGGAIWVDCVESLVISLPHVVHSAQFFGWHESVAAACRTFCILCQYDPALVECYIGVKFEQFVGGLL